MKKKSRAQASFEYIVIYGWATLIILASVGVLYSFDLLNFNSFIGDKCSFYGQVECVESQAIEVGGGVGNMTVVLLNDFGTDLVIYNYSADDEFFDCTGQSNVHANWPENERIQLNISPCGSADDDFLEGSRTDTKVTVFYYRNTTLCDDGVNPINENCLLRIDGRVQETISEPFS